MRILIIYCFLLSFVCEAVDCICEDCLPNTIEWYTVHDFGDDPNDAELAQYPFTLAFDLHGYPIFFQNGSLKRASIPVAPWIRACDTSIASSRRGKTIGTGLGLDKSADPEIWLPGFLKIPDFTSRLEIGFSKLYWRWEVILELLCNSTSTPESLSHYAPMGRTRYSQFSDDSHIDGWSFENFDAVSNNWHEQHESGMDLISYTGWYVANSYSAMEAIQDVRMITLASNHTTKLSVECKAQNMTLLQKTLHIGNEIVKTGLFKLWDLAWDKRKYNQLSEKPEEIRILMNETAPSMTLQTLTPTSKYSIAQETENATGSLSNSAVTVGITESNGTVLVPTTESNNACREELTFMCRILQNFYFRLYSEKCTLLM
ncbi:hypothetical protein DdX_12805 [Ditylenchus destructor]|uniref:Uncharacterized protein n=1 Tax=Ditylenchus destructor TaxID=166010 RepID=A0AAD4MY58_9BILA|nr:hypothetical protein DdX_12805 [Ditylenchus destructor]